MFCYLSLTVTSCYVNIAQVKHYRYEVIGTHVKNNA